MKLWQIIAAMIATYVIGYGQGRSEGGISIQANAPIVCTADGKVTTCK